MAGPVDRVVVVGSKQLGLRCLELLGELDPDRLAGLVTIDDRDDRRSRYDELHAAAARLGVEVAVAGSRQESEVALEAMRPGLGLVAGWYWLLPDRLLGAAPAGYAGIHYSLLPRYRGSSPLVWALLNGDDTVGLSLFRLGAGMDDGPLWGQRSISGVADAYIGDVAARLDDEAIGLLREVYPGMVDGSAEPRAQDDIEPTYAAARTPDDGRLDWALGPDDLARRVRAQSDPYPGAWTRLGDERLTIWRARPADATWYASPGQVVARETADVLVGCAGDRVLRLEAVALGDGPVRPAAEVLRSVRARLGP